MLNRAVQSRAYLSLQSKIMLSTMLGCYANVYVTGVQVSQGLRSLIDVWLNDLASKMQQLL